MTDETHEEQIQELLSGCTARQLAEMYVLAIEREAARLMRVKARPLGESVLIKVLNAQTGTVRGPGIFPFVISQDEDGNPTLDTPHPAANVQPARGVIVSAGPGYVVHGPESRHYVQLDTKPGDEVLFFTDHALEVEVAGERLWLAAESRLLVVLDSMDGDPARAGVTEDSDEDA